MADVLRDDEGNTTLNPVVKRAKTRFKRCKDWEGNFRKYYLEDIKFANADSDNRWQWPNSVRQNRDIDNRPCLTINKTKQHCLQIINEGKQNTPSIKVKATGNGATKEAAEAIKCLFRRIESKSKAKQAYDWALMTAVYGGIGYWRIITDYADENSMEQEIFIQRIKDPMAVYLDPDIKEFDGRDAKFGFVFDKLTREEFEKEYPEWKDKIPAATMDDDIFVGKDYVLITEYFEKTETQDTLLSFVDEQGQRTTVMKSMLPKNVYEGLLEDPQTRTRKVKKPKITWYKLVGDEQIDSTPWPGRYVPLVRLPGEELEIEGQLERKGHTRTLKDPQRMYNYWTSAAAEGVALQGKTPWVGPIEAFEGFEDYWKTANTENHAYLPYRGFDEDNGAITPPQRQDGARMAQAYVQGMQIAQQELMMVSGQYNNEMGEQGNERTGKAIVSRQRQGDTATYHYIDNLAMAIRFTGDIILDLFPKIYDTKRIILAMADDNEPFEVQIDPQAKQAFQVKLARDQSVAARIFNPNVGNYEVESDVGPGYSTRREETAEALTMVISQRPELLNTVGDLLFRALDFPVSEEVADRLKRLVPGYVLGQGPSPTEQMLQEQLQAAQQALGDALEKLGAANIKLMSREALRDIEAYDSETKRFAALKDALPLDEAGIKQVLQQLVQEALASNLQPLQDSIRQKIMSGNVEEEGGNDPTGEGTPPVQGATRGPDGKWYVTHPNDPTQVMEVQDAQQQ